MLNPTTHFNQIFDNIFFCHISKFYVDYSNSDQEVSGINMVIIMNIV